MILNNKQKDATFSVEMLEMLDFSKVKFNCPRKLIPFFFLSGFSFTDTDDQQDSRRREGIIYYFTPSLPIAHEHSGIYLQLRM